MLRTSGGRALYRYRSVWQDGRVRSVYCGPATAADVAAEQARRGAQLRAREERRRLRAELAPLDTARVELDREVRHRAAEELRARGWIEHHRGWRWSMTKAEKRAARAAEEARVAAEREQRLADAREFFESEAGQRTLDESRRIFSRAVRALAAGGDPESQASNEALLERRARDLAGPDAPIALRLAAHRAVVDHAIADKLAAQLAASAGFGVDDALVHAADLYARRAERSLEALERLRAQLTSPAPAPVAATRAERLARLEPVGVARQSA